MMIRMMMMMMMMLSVEVVALSVSLLLHFPPPCIILGEFVSFLPSFKLLTTFSLKNILFLDIIYANII